MLSVWCLANLENVFDKWKLYVLPWSKCQITCWPFNFRFLISLCIEVIVWGWSQGFQLHLMSIPMLSYGVAFLVVFEMFTHILAITTVTEFRLCPIRKGQNRNAKQHENCILKSIFFSAFHDFQLNPIYFVVPLFKIRFNRCGFSM